MELGQQIVSDLGAVAILVDIAAGFLLGSFVEAFPVGGGGKLAVWVRRLVAVFICGGVAAWASWMGHTADAMPQWWTHGILTGALAAVGHLVLPGVGRAVNRWLKRKVGGSERGDG